ALVEGDPDPTCEPGEEVLGCELRIEVGHDVVERREDRRKHRVEGLHESLGELVLLVDPWQSPGTRMRTCETVDQPAPRHGFGHEASTRTRCSYEKTSACGASSILSTGLPRSPVVGSAACSFTSSTSAAPETSWRTE